MIRSIQISIQVGYAIFTETGRLLAVLVVLGWRRWVIRHATGASVRDALQTLGPVYVKIGQVLSTRSDLLAPDLIAALSELREQVQPEAPTRMQAVLARSFPPGAAPIFAQMPTQPIACGCVAQVYQAHLTSGERVAVKVLRPGVRTRIEANFTLLYGLLFLVEFSARVRAMGVRGMLHEIRELMLTQTDLRHEVANYRRFNASYAQHPWIRLPKVYESLSSAEVLVLEFIDAVAPYAWQTLPLSGKQLASRIDHLLDTMVFIKGLCHADLHPGNFFWDQPGNIVLIDLGLAHQFSQLERTHVMTFYLSLVEGHYDFATRYFIQYFVEPQHGKPLDESSRTQVQAEAHAVIHAQYAQSGGKPNFSVMFNQLIRIMYRFKLRLMANYAKIFLTLVTVEGYLYSLDPEFDMVENARKSRMKQAEYTQVPIEAERLVLGDFGTYSTALFGDGNAARQAWEDRDRYALDTLNLAQGEFLIDVGCGRGNLLHKAQLRQWRSLGITISRFEHEACQQRQLATIWSSWEDFERDHGAHHPKAHAITAIEVLFHLANLHENREGLLVLRLSHFFAWAKQRLHDGGKLFLQTLNVVPEFISGTRHQEEYQRLTQALPWMGFTTVPQIQTCSAPFFTVIQQENHSADLAKTFTYMQTNIRTHEQRLRELVPADMYAYMEQELALLLELAQKGILQLHRWLLIKAQT